MMKSLHFLLLSLCLPLVVFAQITGDGYYRVQNYMSKRYVYITDDKGKLNYATTSADMYAIQLWKGFEKAESDPASICYVTKVNDKYDIQAQGTGVYEVIGMHVSLRKTNTDNTYLIYGSNSGITKYLCDGEQADCDEGVLSDGGSGKWRYWYFLPVSASSANYFGIQGSLRVGNYFYRSFYASFPYRFCESSDQAYYVDRVENGLAVMKPIVGVVPAATPVFVRLDQAEASDNKVDIGGSASAIESNLLRGVYFDNPMKSHYNRTPYDPQTMRLLGQMSDGSIGFITSDIDFIPANHSYLVVPAGSPQEIRLVTEEEFELANVLPTSVVLDHASLELTEGDTRTLSAKVAPDNAIDKSLRWSSSNESVVKVAEQGLLTALKPGTATIKATTVNGLTAECLVTVLARQVKVERITLDKTDYAATEGTQFQLIATVFPENATQPTLAWSSSNEALATVDQTGMVSVKQAGEVVITAAATDGSQQSASCRLSILSSLPSVFMNHKTIDVYRLDGVLVGKNMKLEELNELPSGVYLVEGKVVYLVN